MLFEFEIKSDMEGFILALQESENIELNLDIDILDGFELCKWRLCRR